MVSFIFRFSFISIFGLVWFMCKRIHLFILIFWLRSYRYIIWIIVFRKNADANNSKLSKYLKCIDKIRRVFVLLEIHISQLKSTIVINSCCCHKYQYTRHAFFYTHCSCWILINIYIHSGFFFLFAVCWFLYV